MYRCLNIWWVIKKIFLLFCLMILLPVSASAEFKGLHPPMEIEPELTGPPSIEGMLFVKGGCYEMGDTFGDGGEWERPVHTVCVDDFYIGKYEVTQEEWVEVMDNNPSKQERLGSLPSWDEVIVNPLYNDLTDEGKVKLMHRYDFKGCFNCPVENVSWDDVQVFINKRNRKTGKNYRLPTEAEWEYAARSGGEKEKFAGFSDESQLYLYANFCDSNCESNWKTKNQTDGYTNTSPVGSYKPNGLGLYDMTGNVSEWASDWDCNVLRLNSCGKQSYYKKSPKNNPKGLSSGEVKVIRGGSWADGPGIVRASFRLGVTPADRYGNLGFRMVLSTK